MMIASKLGDPNFEASKPRLKMVYTVHIQHIALNYTIFAKPEIKMITKLHNPMRITHTGS